MACRLLTRFGVESAEHLNIEGFARRCDITIEEAALDGARAQLLVSGRRATIVLSESLSDDAERRFAIAHELGHFILKHPSPPLAELCSPRPLDRRSNCRDIEEEANTFAMELLMPAAVVRSLHATKPMTLDVPAKLARLCRVSIIASAIRTTACTDLPCAAVLSERGVVRWVAPSVGFGYTFEPSLMTSLATGKRLDARSLAFDARDHSPHGRPRRVPAAAWLDADSDAPPIVEHSIALDAADAVLTMLWVPQQTMPLSSAWRACVRSVVERRR
jgi:hypothetical protein